MARELLAVSDQNYEQFLRSDSAVLVLTKSTCESCAEYTAGIPELMERPEFVEVAFGKFILDKPGGLNIKRTNPWIADLEFLPHTVLFRQGRIVEEFDASNVSYLEERMRETLMP